LVDYSVYLADLLFNPLGRHPKKLLGEAFSSWLIRASLMCFVNSNRRAICGFVTKNDLLLLSFIVITRYYLSVAGLVVGCCNLTRMAQCESIVVLRWTHIAIWA